MYEKNICWFVVIYYNGILFILILYFFLLSHYYIFMSQVRFSIHFALHYIFNLYSIVLLLIVFYYLTSLSFSFLYSFTVCCNKVTRSFRMSLSLARVHRLIFIFHFPHQVNGRLYHHQINFQTRSHIYNAQIISGTCAVKSITIKLVYRFL